MKTVILDETNVQSMMMQILCAAMNGPVSRGNFIELKILASRSHSDDAAQRLNGTT
jgi:hypothetical protein